MMSPPKFKHPPKVLVTKIGLDGHDRGSRVVAAFLRDAGMEVLYTPPWQEIGQVVRLAEEEDVDVIGISSLATDHLLVPKLMKALKKAGLEHVPVVVGGIVPDEDERKLRKAGVRHVFHPGASREEIVSRVAELAGAKRRRPRTGRCWRETRGTCQSTRPRSGANGIPRWRWCWSLRSAVCRGHTTAAGASPSGLAQPRWSPDGAPCARRTSRLLRTRQTSS